MRKRYCTEFGFDKKGIAARLALLDLSPRDETLSKTLQEKVILPNLDAIIDDFYNYMLSKPVMLVFLDHDAVIKKLKSTQKAYLQSLGVGFSSAEYFEDRLRVGLAHAKVRIPPHLYICAYQKIRELIFLRFNGNIEDTSDLHSQLFSFLDRIIALDMSLAIETYHHIQVSKLESSLHTLQKEEDQLRHRAETDMLTGLSNHVHVVAMLNKAIDSAHSNMEPLCIMMADLDFFKLVNDTHGHLVGDGVLREVAARLRSTLRDIDVVGRYGGEEFMAVFNNTNLRTATEVAERIRMHIASSPVNLQGNAISITISIGVCALQPDDDINTIIERADQALYLAKHSGRNCVKVCEHETAGD